jgi:NAD(P)-dependent dehydrogenase (short-subunit alcohol dehydrogenase family)
MNTRLKGRVALVTGGSRGIGLAIAERFLDEGATVIVAARKQQGVDEAVRGLSARGSGRVHGVAMHVGDVDAIHSGVAQVEQEVGPIDILVNNAATNPHFGPLLSAEPPAWQKTFEVNVFGPMALTRRVTQRMLDDGRRGAVIFISSVLGMQAAPAQGVYGATKAAVLSLTRTLAIELGPAGIRVNAIAPGLVDTRFASVLTNTPEVRRLFEDRTALGRIATPDEISGTAAWLASDDAGYVTGQVIPVDGGYLAR